MPVPKRVRTESSTTVVQRPAQKQKLYRTVRSNTVKNLNTSNFGRGIPKKLTVTHTYVETVNLQSGIAGALAVYSFSANGMYDPNITGTGHQPMLFDQIGALYNHYCVIGSKATFTLTPISGANDCIIGCFLNDDTTTPSRNGILENPTCKYLCTPYLMNTAKSWTLKWSGKQNFGKLLIGNSAFSGTTGSNPAEQSYYTAFIDAADIGTQQTFRLNVKIEYIAIWTERVDIASS